MRCAIALRVHRRIPRSVGPRAVTCLQPGNFFAAIGVATTAVVSSFIIACECFAKKISLISKNTTATCVFASFCSKIQQAQIDTTNILDRRY